MIPEGKRRPGRPRKENAFKHSFRVYLSAEQFEKLEKLALKHANGSASKWIRDIIDKA